MPDVITEAQAPTVSATFNGSIQTLPEVMSTLSAVNDLWALCQQLATDREQAGSVAVSGPWWDLSHVSIRKSSPMWLEVGVEIATSPPGVLLEALGLLGWCLKHPDEIAGFLPRLKEQWHRGWHKADQAEAERRQFNEFADYAQRTAYKIMQAVPGDVELSDELPDFDDRPRPWEQDH